MIKRVSLIGILSVIILLTACIDSTTVISVRKDGSGTITEVMYIDESVTSMMEGMFAEMGGEEEKEKGKKPIDVEEYKSKAMQLGADVKFVSAKEVARGDGASGIEVVYAFDDVRKLNIQATPDNPMGDEMAGMMGAESTESEEAESPITFDFKKGGTSQLIIHMPEKDEPEVSEEVPEAAEESPEMAAQGMAMMKQFLAGFRIRIMVNVLEGKIQKTNASFVDNKDTVTLFDIEMGEIFSNEEYLKEWQSMSQVKDMSTAMQKMKNIPGLKIETAERVEINFK